MLLECERHGDGDLCPFLLCSLKGPSTESRAWPVSASKQVSRMKE